MITAVLVGAGNRGKDAYGAWALENSHRLKFAAVAEPLTARREAFAAAHGLPPERCYPGWGSLLQDGWPTSVSLRPRTACILHRPWLRWSWATMSCWKSPWPLRRRTAAGWLRHPKRPAGSYGSPMFSAIQDSFKLSRRPWRGIDRPHRQYQSQ